jgi:hypothetical protein
MKDNNSQNNNTSNSIANQALQKKSEGVSLKPPTTNLSSSTKTKEPIQKKGINASPVIEPGSNIESLAISLVSQPSVQTNFSDNVIQKKDEALLAADMNTEEKAKELSNKTEDGTLLNILKHNFNADWFYTKDVLTMQKWPEITNKPSHQNSLTVMGGMIKMRAFEWDKFKGKAEAKVKEEVTNAGIEPASKEEIEINKNADLMVPAVGDAVGADSVTSDKDLSMQGQNTEIGIKVVNKEFKEHFGVNKEPGALFDINVYASDWMFGTTEVAGDKKKGEVAYNITSEAKKLTGKELSKDGQKKKDEQNEVWSLVKIRRNMNNRQWLEYKFLTISAIKAIEEKEQTEKAFVTANQEFHTFEKEVDDKLKGMEKAVDNEEDHYAKDAKKMEASNRLYEEKNLKVKQLRVQIAKMKEKVVNDIPNDVENLLLELHNEISRGLTYANEVYATEGAVLHTVVGKQGAKKKLKELQAGKTDKGKESTSTEITEKEKIKSVKYNISKEQYLQSVNENVGDTLHSLHHYEKDRQYAAYRAGKYLARLYDAAEELISIHHAKGMPHYSVIKEIADNSVTEKDGEAGKDPLSVKTNKESFFFRYVNQSQLDKIAQQAIEFGANVSAFYKNNKPKT